MSDLLDPSLVNLAERRANTPAVLPGYPIADRLIASRNAAREILFQYTDQLDQYDDRMAAHVVDQVESWADQNNDALMRALSSGQTELPTALQLTLGGEQARSFILSLYIKAAVGISVHVDGTAERAVMDGASIGGVRITSKLVQDDAQARLDCFGIILRMEETGALRQLFTPAGGTSGLGAIQLAALPLTWVLLILGAVAAVIVGIVSWKAVDKFAPIIDGLAIRAGDPGKTARDLACAIRPGCNLEDAIGEGAKNLLTIVGAGLALWIAVKAYSSWSAIPSRRRLTANRRHRRRR